LGKIYHKPYRMNEKKPYNLSAIGFGGLTISGVWGTTDDSTSIKAIHEAIAEGINWIDTSPIYGIGHSEHIIGEAIKGKRNKIIIATKCGLYLGEDGKAKRNLKPEFIFQDIDRSLQRLNVSEIDLYQCHWPDPETPIEETWEAMRELVKKGKVKEIGICNFNVTLLERIQKIHPAYSIQIPYNIIRREYEKEIIPFCVDNNIKVLAYSPLHLGLLSGNYNPTLLSHNDRRLKAQEWGNPEEVDRYLSFIEKIRPIAQAKNINVVQLVIAWLLNAGCVSSIICGMRTPLHVSQNIKAIAVTLSRDEMELLDFSRQTFSAHLLSL